MRWLVDNLPGSPEHNMAVDSALLASLAAGGDAEPTIRIYSWDRAAVSIGRLQNEDPVRLHYPGLPIVRRPTGGRAVLHGEDLTISVAVRLEWLPVDCRSILSSHQIIMHPVAAALKATGLDVCYGGCALENQSRIINCFDLSAACDLIDSQTGTKLVGSAQRREKETLLQQMSLPIRMISDQAKFLSRLQQEFGQTFGSY